MNLRLALYELSARHGLDADRTHRLHRLAGLHDEPPAVAQWLPRGIAMLAAALAGLGVVFWVAANWDTLGRFGRFAVLQALIVVTCAGAAARARARSALGLIALLAIGALLATFGQTYQTGADPWQLFALWAALALPLCLAVRSDVLWTPWIVVALTGVSLWVHAHAGHRWTLQPGDLPVHLAGWLAAGLLVLASSSPLRRFTGAAVWSHRAAATLAIAMVTATAVLGLFSKEVAPQYALGLAVLAVAVAGFASARGFDIYGLSAASLGVDVVLVGGLVRLLFQNLNADVTGTLLLLGLVAAGLLAVTVSAVLRLSRRHAAREAT
jgi:uncharacterized membrane protein